MANLNTYAKNKIITKLYFVLVLLLSKNQCWSLDLIPNNTVNSIPMVRIKMAGAPSYLDETVIYYQTGATSGFDSEFDSYKISGPNPVPEISQNWNNTLISINGVPPVSPTFSTYINTTTPISKTFTITAADYNFLPAGTCIYLNDLYTGTTTNLLQNSYVFFLSDTTSHARFSISITHFEQPITSSLTQPTCVLINGGKIKITGNDNAPWNYVWRDSTNTIIKTSTNQNYSDSLYNLAEGIYRVEVFPTNNACYYSTTSFTVNKIIHPVVNFTSPDSINISAASNFNPVNESLNCNNFTWDFGDGIGTSTDYQPSYIYYNSGVFSIKLKGVSSSGCMDSITKAIKVKEIATGIVIQNKQNIGLFIDEYSNYYIKINDDMNELKIQIYDLNGAIILSETKTNILKNNTIALDTGNIKTGIYILDVYQNNQINIHAKFIKK